MGWLQKFLTPEGMVPEAMRHGELPGTNEAYRSVLKIAVPSVLEMALMSLISMIDTMMVATLGTDAIAAVGLVTQPRMVMLCVFFGLNAGVTAIVARRRGEGRREDANMTLRNSLMITVLLIVAIMAVAVPFAEVFMRWVGGEEGRTLEDATTYFRIIALALPVNTLSMCICAAQRGAGNMKLTMYVNMTSNLVNVVFNWILINGIGPFPQLGVRGAALATAIGLCVGFVLSLISLVHPHWKTAFLSLSIRDRWKFDKGTLSAISKVGKSAMLEQVCVRAGFLLYAVIVASLGTDAYAAHIIAMQFLTLSFSIGDGLGVAGTALVGQSLGRQRPDYAHLYGKIIQRMALLCSVCLAVAVIGFRSGLVGLFINSSDANAEYVSTLAMRLMVIVGLMQPFQTSGIVTSGALRGAGDTRFVAFSMVLTVVVMRPLLSLLAILVFEEILGYPDLALVGVWCMALTDIITRMILLLKRYNGGKWHAIQV